VWFCVGMAACHSTEMHVCVCACVRAREGAAAVAAAGALPDLAALAQHGSPAECAEAAHAVANLLAGGGGGGGDAALLPQVRSVVSSSSIWPKLRHLACRPRVAAQLPPPHHQTRHLGDFPPLLGREVTACHHSQSGVWWSETQAMLLGLCGAAVTGHEAGPPCASPGTLDLRRWPRPREPPCSVRCWRRCWPRAPACRRWRRRAPARPAPAACLRPPPAAPCSRCRLRTQWCGARPARRPRRQRAARARCARYWPGAGGLPAGQGARAAAGVHQTRGLTVCRELGLSGAVCDRDFLTRACREPCSRSP
jgi:hypothetical protein